MSKTSLFRSSFLVLTVAALAGLPVELARAQDSMPFPDVEPPGPTMEASPFPALDDVVPPSLTDDPDPVGDPPEPVPMDGSTLEGPGPHRSMDGPMVGSPMMDGPMMDGPMTDGPMMDGPMMDGPMGQPIYEDGYGYPGGGVIGSELDYPADSICADGEPAPIYSTGTWYKRGNVFFNFGYVHLARENPRDQAILLDPGVAIFTSNNLVSHRYQPGVRLEVGRFLGRDASHRDHLVEFRFMGLVEWSDFRRVSSSSDGDTLDTLLGSVANPATAGLTDNRTQTYQYDAEYDSFEANYRLHTRPQRDVLALQPNGAWVRHGIDSVVRELFVGLRAASFNELVDYRGLDANDALEGRYGVLTNNDLFGLQAGMDSTVKHDSWSWGLRGKLGLLAAFAQRRSNVTDGVGNSFLNQTIEDEDLAFNAEGGFFATYQLRPNLHFKAGYDFIYYTGLALAPENLGFTNGFEELNTQGGVLMHGGSITFETTW